MDVRKIFDSIDHEILLKIVSRHVKDAEHNRAGNQRRSSYEASSMRGGGEKTRLEKGSLIGNLTSQLFANAYMNEFDQFMRVRMVNTMHG